VVYMVLLLTMLIFCSADIERLESTKLELQSRITEEVTISPFEYFCFCELGVLYRW